MPPRRSSKSSASRKRQDAKLTKRMDQFMAIDFAVFTNYTNITDIIQSEFAATNPGERLTNDQLFERQEEYFDKVSDLNSWRKDGALAELKFIEEHEMEQHETKGPDIPLAVEVSQFDRLINVLRRWLKYRSLAFILFANVTCISPQQNIEPNESQAKPYKKEWNLKQTPTAIQQQFLDMDYDQFVRDTNIDDLIRRDHRIKYPDVEIMPRDTLERCQMYSYKSLDKLNKWHKSIFKDLKVIRPVDMDDERPQRKKRPSTDHNVISDIKSVSQFVFTYGLFYRIGVLSYQINGNIVSKVRTSSRRSRYIQNALSSLNILFLVYYY